MKTTLIAAIGLILAIACAARAATPEEVWEKQYAKKYKTVSATPDKSDDADFLVKLVADARLADDVAMRVYLLSKAVEIGSGQVETMGIAIDAIETLEEFLPDQKNDLDQKMIGLYKKLAASGKNPQAAEELVLKYLSQGEEKAAAGDFEGAIPLYREAQKASVGLPIAKELNFRVMLDRAAAIVEVQKKIRALPVPMDALKLVNLVRSLIEDMDEPRAALPFISNIRDLHLTVMIPAATQPVLTLKLAECQSLAEWYLELADTAKPACRTTLLIKAKMYATRAVALAEADAAAGTTAIGLLTKVDATLAKQNINAAVGQQMLAKARPDLRYTLKLPPEQCDAIKRASKWLLSRRREWGHWDTQAKQADGRSFDGISGEWGGRSAIVAWALLMAGEDPVRNTKFRPAVRFLATERAINGTAAVGLRLRMVGALPDPQQYRDVVQYDMGQLFSSVEDDGLFGDTLIPRIITRKKQSPRPTNIYQSCYAWAGIAEAVRLGALVNPEIAYSLADTLLSAQRPDGAWPGIGEKPTVDIGKTMAALSMLQSITPLLTSSQKESLKERIAKALSAIDEAISKDGLIPKAAVVLKDDAVPKDGLAASTIPFLLGIQQIAHPAKRREFGVIGTRAPWFAPGAKVILESQAGDGSWKQDPVLTAQALIYLTLGDAPQ